MDKNAVKGLFSTAKTEAKDNGSTGDFKNPPVGIWPGKILKAEYYVSAKGKVFNRVKWELETDEGVEQYDQYAGIDNPIGLKIQMQEWMKLGVDTEAVIDFETFAETAAQLAGYEFKVNVEIKQNKNGFTTYTIKDVISYNTGEDEGASEPAPESSEEGEAEYEAGDTVTFKNGDEELTGIVLISEPDDGLVVKVGKKKYPVAFIDVLSKED